MRLSLRRAVVIAVLMLPASMLFAAPAGAGSSTALNVEAVAASPQHAHGTDGREHIAYNLVITNSFSAPATLRSIEVRGDGRLLQTLRGGPLQAATTRLFALPFTPTLTIAAASSVYTMLDVALPRSAGRSVPRRITHRIRYAIPADAPGRSLIASTTVNAPDVRTDRRAPIVIAPPLRGSGWLDANGCCEDPSLSHRNSFLPWRGRYVNFEVFDIDWIRAVGGAIYTGDGTRNEDWPAFGRPVDSVAAGTVVSAIDGKPDIPPKTDNPDLRTPVDYRGNSVIVRIGPGRYAIYGHMVNGSVRVRRGQRVRTGQQLGRLGNSGNTGGPHLHFGIHRHPDFFSESVPWEIDRLTLQGMADPNVAPPRVDLIGTPRVQRRTFPLLRAVVRFPVRTPAPPPLAGRR